jgi:hypothetical protein
VKQNARDEIKYWKSELKLYNLFVRKIETITLELEAVAVNIQGIRSPSNHGVVKIENHSFNSNRILELMYEEESLVKERAHYQERKDSVDELLDSMEEEIKNILIDVYIRNMSYDAAANKYSISRRNLFYKINKNLQ